jgi:molybdopterin-guanine dinucleotide biosynthesis protein B
MMRRVHVVGRKNHGKTTLVVELIAECTRRGLRVGSVKHSSHVHELDKPGKDSYRHREAGANPSAIVTQDMIGVTLRRVPGDDHYAQLAPFMADCDLVIIEGDYEHPGPKIEVWRASVGGACLATSNPEIVAVVSDDPVDAPVPVWPRSDVAEVARRILALLG